MKEVKTQEIKIKMVGSENDFPLGKLVSNRMNNRQPSPETYQAGYGVFVAPEGSDKPTLLSLLLSSDKKKQEEGIKILDKFDDEFANDAENMKEAGQLQAIRIRKEEHGYDVIFGARRCLQRAYLHAKYGMPATIRADIVEADDYSARLSANSENARRKDANPIELGLYFAQLKKENNCSFEQVGAITGVNWQTCRRLATIATSKHLTETQREQVAEGKIGTVKAYELVTGKTKATNPKAVKTANSKTAQKNSKAGPGRRVAPTLKKYEEWYMDDASLHEEVRKFIANRILECEYKTYKQCQEMKAKEEKEEKEEKKAS